MLGAELKAVRAVFHFIFMTALRATALFFPEDRLLRLGEVGCAGPGSRARVRPSLSDLAAQDFLPRWMWSLRLPGQSLLATCGS